MNNLSIAYFGSPDFSAEVLEHIIHGDLPVAVRLVVTQPDKPVGRKHTLTPSPVKLVAQKNAIPVFHSLDHPDLFGLLSQVDIAIVFAYGFKVLIKKELLGAPKMHFGAARSGFVNIHPSLLPKYRGSSPLSFPLMLGEEKTGISLFAMDEKMDHGPILSQTELPLNEMETRTMLQDRLTKAAYPLIDSFCSTCANNGAESFSLIEQTHTQATHAHYLTRDHGFVQLPTIVKAMANKPLMKEDLPQVITTYLSKYTGIDPICSLYATNMLNHPGKTLYDMYRGISPWPGLWTIINKNGERRLKIIQATMVNGSFHPLKVQLEGKQEVDYGTFVRAYGELSSL